MAPSAIDPPAQGPSQSAVTSPPRLYPVKEAHFEKFLEPQPDGYEQAVSRGSSNVAIVIDNGNLRTLPNESAHGCGYMLIAVMTGSSATRAGWSFENAPRFIISPIMSRYRDRKLGKTYAFAGSDVYADTTAKGHMRNAFEAGSGIVSNWDVMESVLDYIFLKMGIDGANGSVDMPIVMTEAVANLPYSRKCKI